MKTVIKFLTVVFLFAAQLSISFGAGTDCGLLINENHPNGGYPDQHFLATYESSTVINYSADGLWGVTRASSCSTCDDQTLELWFSFKHPASSGTIEHDKDITGTNINPLVPNEPYVACDGSQQPYAVCDEPITVADTDDPTAIYYSLKNDYTAFDHEIEIQTLPGADELDDANSILTDFSGKTKTNGAFSHVVTFDVRYEVPAAQEDKGVYVRFARGNNPFDYVDVWIVPSGGYGKPAVGRRPVKITLYDDNSDSRSIIYGDYDVYLYREETGADTELDSYNLVMTKVADLNGDGVVNDADKTIGIANNGSTTTKQGDCDFDGEVEWDNASDDDWVIWEAQN